MCTSTTRRTASPTRPCGSSSSSRDRAGSARPDRRDVPRRQDQHHRGPRGPARRAPRARGRGHRGRRRERRAAGARGAAQDGRLQRARALGRLDGTHRQVGTQRREHRHRWLRPRPRDGRGGAARLQPSRHDVPLRQQRRRHRLLGVHPRPRPGRDAVRRVVEDVHDARDAHQRAERARVARRGTRRRARGRQALRRGVDERGRGREVRDRHREHVRVLGLGGRPLLVRLGHRAVVDDRDRPRAVRRDARGLPLDRRALPHRAVRAEPAGAARPHRHLVRRLLRRADPGDPARTASTSRGFPRTSSSSTWRATASPSTSTATR